MAGVVFVISEHYAVHWERAVSAGFWESKSNIPVDVGDLLVFWLAGQKHIIGVGHALAATEAVDYSEVVRPWLPDDTTTYEFRYRFAPAHADNMESLRWKELMTYVGANVRRGANTAPITFSTSGAQALSGYLGLSPVEGLVKARLVPSTVAPGDKVGRPFVKRHAVPVHTMVPTPTFRDPDNYGAALNAHRNTENAIAALVSEAGLQPQDPTAGGPNYDLAWFAGDRLVVCEIKSLTGANEWSQIRLGLGQVLDYAYTLGKAGHEVEPWLVVDHEPSSAHWAQLCDEHGVTLCWPEIAGSHLDAATPE
ncbi:hypothetical protein ACQCX2_09320 [Propionibacteriaceae bacterium Y1700]|uniref:hypothetical protein n=1 Tax=Microlunatus sp. Y1700 TaxID=3418487 RepID=UPI003DA74F6E